MPKTDEPVSNKVAYSVIGVVVVLAAIGLFMVFNGNKPQPGDGSRRLPPVDPRNSHASSPRMLLPSRSGVSTSGLSIPGSSGASSSGAPSPGG